MSNSYDSLKQVVGSVVNYDEVVAAIGIALDVLDDDNYEIDTRSIEDAIYAENDRRSAVLPTELRYRRAFRKIADYLKLLIVASTKEHIAQAGEFRIPDGGANDDDYVFNLGVIEKFEIQNTDCWKHEDEERAVIDVELTGSLLKLFEHYKCDHLRIRAEFWADRYAEIIEIDEIEHVENMFKDVRIDRNNALPLEMLESLAEELNKLPNKNLSHHFLKYSKT